MYTNVKKKVKAAKASKHFHTNITLQLFNLWLSNLIYKFHELSA